MIKTKTETRPQEDKSGWEDQESFWATIKVKKKLNKPLLKMDG